MQILFDISSRFPVISADALRAIRAAEAAELAAVQAAEEAEQNALGDADGSPAKPFGAPVRRRKSGVTSGRKRRRPPATQQSKAEETAHLTDTAEEAYSGPPPTPKVSIIKAFPQRRFARPRAEYSSFVDKRQKTMDEQVGGG